MSDPIRFAYEQVRKEFLDNPVQHTEVPTEHSISLPLPTLRWSLPAFAGFAGPAARTPGRPLRLGVPDRWWALHARTRRLVAYGLTAAVPFAETLGTEDVVIDRSGRSITQLNEDLRLLDELMDAAAAPFLGGSAASATVRGDLLESLTSVVTTAAVPWYRALAPDFFSWLEG